MKKLQCFLVFAIIIVLMLGMTAAWADGAPGEESAGIPEEEFSEETDTEEGGENIEVPAFDWEQYTYEQLLEIRKGFDEVLQTKQREYAIANGNRKIVFSEYDPQVYVGKTLVLETEVERIVEDAPETTVLVWFSSDESIAKVSAKGEVKAVKAGSVTITCRAADDEFVFSEAEVEVIDPVKALALDNTALTLLISESSEEGNTAQLNCSVLPESAFCKDLIWVSSDESVATVDENGLVTALTPGKVSITAISADPISKDTKPVKTACQVTVNRASSSVELSVAEATLDKKEKITLKATILPEDATNKKVVWESADASVATVSATGQVSAVGCGETVITCAAADGSGAKTECKVTVIQKITSLKFATQNITINRDDAKLLDIAILPEDATNKELDWASSDEKVITVDATGKVTAVGGGKAVVTCVTKDGSNKTASVTIFIPSFKVKNTEYKVVSKSGMSITLDYYGKRSDLTVTSSSKALFEVKHNLSGNTLKIDITPLKAGNGSITLKDKSDSKNTVTLKIVIDHSAVYDTVSYPRGNYSDILRYPSLYNGDNISIYGRVLQVQKSWGGYTLRVATSGGWNNVFYVTGSTELSIIEYDYITIYGKCTGTKTYTTVLGGSITIPSMEIEKVYYGYH